MGDIQAEDESIDIRAKGLIIKDPTSGWLCVELPNSLETFGTRKPVKISGTVDSLEFEVTAMPLGNGNHMIPLRASFRKQLNKDMGDEVDFHFTKRLT